MSDIDPTPDTPATIGDRLGWFRGDVTARLVDLAAAQLAIRGTPEATIREVVTALANLAGEPAGTLGTIQTRLTDIAGELGSGPGISLYNLIDSLYIGQADIQTRLDRLQAGLGAVPYNDLELASTRGLLNAILRTLSAQANGTPPTQIPSDVSNTGDTIALGRRFAVFNPPITGVTVSNDGVTLTPNSNWSGWSFYVQSNAPDASTDNTTVPVNTWVPLTGTAARNWSVLQQFVIRVYLRPPSTQTENYYSWSGADIVQRSTNFGTRWSWSTTKYADLLFINSSPGVFYLRKDVSGWVWRFTGGAGYSSQYSANDNMNPLASSSSITGSFPNPTLSCILQTFTTAPTMIELFLPVGS